MEPKSHSNAARKQLLHFIRLEAKCPPQKHGPGMLDMPLWRDL